nr:hypothetical protein CFP56_72096 [Quercus suber]
MNRERRPAQRRRSHDQDTCCSTDQCAGEGRWSSCAQARPFSVSHGGNCSMSDVMSLRFSDPGKTSGSFKCRQSCHDSRSPVTTTVLQCYSTASQIDVALRRRNHLTLPAVDLA